MERRVSRALTARGDGTVELDYTGSDPQVRAALNLPTGGMPHHPFLSMSVVNYVVTNISARETVGQASYNVSPPTVGGYFTKINCFCFTEQRLKPGEKREMPVVFFVDPALAKDAEQDDLSNITLSYTMYPVRQPEPPRVERDGQATPGRS